MKKIKLFKREDSTFYCFTPLASLVTFIIEIVLASYVLIKFRMSKFRSLAVFILILLGIFQLAEYMICKSSSQLLWAKIGFVSITLLPAVGLDMASVATKKSIWSTIGYMLAVFYSFLILFVPNIILSTSCPGKFVIFNTANFFNSSYEIYYFALILIAIYMLSKGIMNNSPHKKLFSWMIGGYASFLVPTLVIYILEEMMHIGTLSVMCGFAVLFAIILVFKIIPLYQEKSENK